MNTREPDTLSHGHIRAQAIENGRGFNVGNAFSTTLTSLMIKRAEVSADIAAVERQLRKLVERKYAIANEIARIGGS